ncbi:uncharacterized protein F5Z01DRAFT_698962 [Emericellopsis atlantica]|uniref:Uncharacterized protein n=1 Tax=Emericellopsis atlantica TaxID=2614577 RepID=A0A9P7ZPU6_9HYPO|nr:uncharacterized protein F5Z01DRAFT_698962 [Emericellopsis atlantica]KAG9256088.1 hypothetical protein F5Z01DRAFT_698962 [Emericellopsis atlantica]
MKALVLRKSPIRYLAFISARTCPNQIIWADTQERSAWLTIFDGSTHHGKNTNEYPGGELRRKHIRTTSYLEKNKSQAGTEPGGQTVGSGVTDNNDYYRPTWDWPQSTDQNQSPEPPTNFDVPPLTSDSKPTETIQCEDWTQSETAHKAPIVNLAMTDDDSELEGARKAPVISFTMTDGSLEPEVTRRAPVISFEMTDDGSEAEAASPIMADCSDAELDESSAQDAREASTTKSHAEVGPVSDEDIPSADLRHRIENLHGSQARDLTHMDLGEEADVEESKANKPTSQAQRHGKTNLVCSRQLRYQREASDPQDRLHLLEYEGAPIMPPPTILRRARNYLNMRPPTDEDNFARWAVECARICRYVVWLRTKYEGQTWWDDLLVVEGMLEKAQAWRWCETQVIPSRLSEPVPESHRHALAAGVTVADPPPLRQCQVQPDAVVVDPPLHTPWKRFRLPDRRRHSYLAGMSQFDRDQRKWADLTRGRYGSVWQNMRRDGPVVDLPPPANFWGVMPLSGMSKDMLQVWDRLKKLESVKREFVHTLSLAVSEDDTRRFTTMALAIDDGLLGTDPSNAQRKAMRFRLDEFMNPSLPIPALFQPQTLVDIRPAEVEWLEFFSTDLPEVPARDTCGLDTKGKAFMRKIQAMIDCHDPKFRLGPHPRSRQLIQLFVNDECESEGELAESDVKKAFFTEEEVANYLEIAEGMGLQTEKGVTSRDPHYCKAPQLFALDAIRWFAPVKNAQSSATSSAQHDVRNDDEPDTEYLQFIPSKDMLRSVPEIKRGQPAEATERTTGFYTCLAYRMGLTLRRLRTQHEANLVLLGDPERIRRNVGSAAYTATLWDVECLGHTWLQYRHPGHGDQLVVPLFKDVVRKAESGKFRKKWDTADYCDEGEHQAYVIVRKGLIDELCRNDPPEFRKNEAGQDDEATVALKDTIWSFGTVENGKMPNYFALDRRARQNGKLESRGGDDLATPTDSMTLHSTDQKDKGKGKEVVRPQSRLEDATPRGVPRSSVLSKPTYKNWPGMGYDLEDEDWVVEERWDRHGKLHRDMYVPLARVVEKQKTGRTLHRGRPLVGATPRDQRAIEQRLKRGGADPPAPTFIYRFAVMVGLKRKRDDDPEDDRVRLPSPKYLPKVVARVQEEPPKKKKRRSSVGFGGTSVVEIRDPPRRSSRDEE